uniref:Uncharacterized protein n=1 Tax=Arundo donax TaxID=35708 RepID=A0A0A8YYW9_ARUDO
MVSMLYSKQIYHIREEIFLPLSV